MQIVEVDEAFDLIKSLTGNKPVSFLPGGKILTFKGVDLRRVLLESRLAVAVQYNPDEDGQDVNEYGSQAEEGIEEDTEGLVVNSEYDDRTCSPFLSFPLC